MAETILDRSYTEIKIVEGVDLPRKEEQELLENIAFGDADAFEQLFNEHWEFLHNVAYNRLQSVEAADDLVQEVFVDFWNKRCSLQIHTSLKAYLYQAIKYKVFNYIRYQSVRHKKEYEVLIRREYYSEHARSSVDEDVEARELRQIVDREVEQLSEKSRQIFQLSRNEHYTYQKIADQMDCSIKTVEYHISKVLDKLKVKVRQYRTGLLSLAITLLDILS